MNTVDYSIIAAFKVHVFWEGHKILRNLHQLFDWQYIGQIIGGDFAKFSGPLRIYELYYLIVINFFAWTQSDNTKATINSDILA